MISTFDCCSPFAGKLSSGPSFFLTNPFHVREFRVFRRRRLKHHRHGHHRIAFTVRSQSNPFESLFHSLVSQVTTVNSLELIAPALGFSSGVALYLSNVVSAKSYAVSDIGKWILLSSPTPFNRFVFLRCPSIAFPGSDANPVEDASEKLVKEDGHFVRLHSGRIKAANGDDALEDKLTYQRLCLSTEDGGVISLDWPSNLNLREEDGMDTTLLLVPGTPEGSTDRNVRLSVIEALGRGLFPIVINPRGCAGSPLTTARLFSAADSDDIYTAVQFISKARPWTALIAIGWGYGSNMLTKYLAEVGERTPLTAATCIDNPFDLEEATQTPPYHMARDQDLTGGLINILRSNKELFQGKEKGFDVEKALEAKSVRDFEKLITSVSHGFNSIEDFYSKSSSRSVVGNVKIPVLYIQNDNGSAPIFSIPRSLIAANPFTSLLLCSYSPSSIISSMQPVLSWCQQLSIEWLTAVELGLLKGRHPLLKDVDITLNSSRDLALVEGRTVEERGKVIRQLDFNSSDASSNQSTRFIKKKLEESHSSIHTDLRSQNDSQGKSQLEDKESLEIEVRVLDQTSSISANMGKEVSSEDTKKGQVLWTAEVVMNILEITNPGFLTEEEKKKVLNAVGKGETLMKALQDAVPEEVRGKLTTAVSGILHAQGSNLKGKDLIGTSHKSNAALELKRKTEEKVGHVADAEGYSQIASPLHEMGDVNDVSDDSDSYQPTKDKFIGELESEPPSSDKLQKSIDQNGSQTLDIHGDDTISPVRKETSGSGTGASTAQYLYNSEKELDINVKPEFSSKAEQVGSHDVAIGDDYKDQGGEIAQSDDKEENKPKKNEEKPVDPSNDDKVVSSFTKEETFSSPGSTSEAQPGEQECNNDQKDNYTTQPFVEHTKPVVSESNVNNLSVSQALDALTGIDDSTQVAVNSVFNVIENMISQLEGSENEGEDKKTDFLLDNHCSGNETSSGKKENILSVKPERLSSPRTNNNLERRGDSKHDVTSGREGEDFTSHLVSISGSYLIRSQSAAQAGKYENEKDKLLDDLDGNVDMASNMYLDSVQNNFVLKYDASNAPTKSLDKVTTTALLLDYIPEEGQWKFIEQPRIENGAVSTCEGVDEQVNACAHAKVKNTDDVIEPLYMILDSDNQPEPVGEYQTAVNGKEEIEGNDGSKDLEYFVRTIIQDCLQVEVGRRLSAANKDLKLGVDRDIEHVANLLSVSVGYGSGRSCRQCLGSESDSINSTADKMGTLSGEQIIRSISSSVQETVYLKKVLPLGVIIGSSLAALRESFHVTTLHDDNQGERLAIDQAKKSGERNHEVNNGGEPTQNVILTDTVCGEGGSAEMRNLNKDTVVVGAVTAALGASAVLVHQQNLYEANETTESSFKSKEKASLQKDPERHDEQIPHEKNHNIVTAFAEKAMSVASPVVPKKEDGEVDEERLVAMLAELGEKGGILKLVGRVALLWGGIRTAMSVTEKLISILRIAERPLFQRILGSVGLVLVLWSPITLPLLPKLIDSWTSRTPSKISNLACGFGLYIALTILVMMWGKRIRGYENPAKEYGLDLTSWSKIYDFIMAFFGGVSVLLGIQFVNGFLGYTTLSWPAIPTLVNLVSWLKVFGGSLLLVSIGIISSVIVSAVEELLFRSWLTEEIALDLGYYPGIIMSGLAFAISQRSLQAIPVLWVLSLGLAGARQRREGCLSIPIGLRAGITASSFIFQKGGFISYKASIPMHHPVWIMCIDAHQPLSGVAGFAFALLVACIFFPRNPMEKKNLKRAIRE